MTVVTERQRVRQPWSTLLHRVVKTIRAHGLIHEGQHALIGLSGGPDSVALLSLLHRLRESWALTLSGLHVNYGLRGAESDEDEAFVVALCKEWAVPLTIRHIDVRARQCGASLQKVARELRYQAYQDAARAAGVDRIALGHTADDQAETVLLWMLRGAGLRGLSGMPAVRDGGIIRPLYEIRRENVLAYLAETGLSYRRDSSNDTRAYARNRIRHDVLPALTRVAPAAVTMLCRLASLCRADDEYLEDQAEAAAHQVFQETDDGDWTVDPAQLARLPVALQRRILRNLLRRRDDEQRAPALRLVEELRARWLVTETPFRLSMRHADVRLDVHELQGSGRPRVTGEPQASDAAQRNVLLPVGSVPSHVLWAPTGHIISAQYVSPLEAAQSPSGRWRIVVDGDAVTQPLVVRTWKPGDRFMPLGMHGRSKKLQDFFTDAKVPRTVRNSIPIVAAPDGIVWIVGYRQDERWVATPETRHCVVLAAHSASQQEEPQ